MKKNGFCFLFCLLTLASCEKIDLMIGPDVKNPSSQETADAPVSLKDVAVLLSSASLQADQIAEVHDAVSQSNGNGYDEEYTMKDIFESPGSGVGNAALKSSTRPTAKTYTRPLREVFERYYSQTKASASRNGAVCLDYIRNSDMQIYWPYSERWDGKAAPVITFQPAGEASSNIGWYTDADGSVKELVVDEEMALERPVWVINNNDDASFTSLELMRKNNPEWSQGGSLVIGTKSSAAAPLASSASSCRTLVLKEFTMLRNYDSWFAGASEFFVKIASVNDFTASTESELYLYDPSVTDFMVVVKRSQVGIPQELNTVLVSEWTSQLESCAFMIVEDDGGTWTSWDCSAVVKYNSKSFGFEVKIPFRSRDDIVWRGKLSRKYIESSNEIASQFGDVKILFNTVEL